MKSFDAALQRYRTERLRRTMSETGKELAWAVFAHDVHGYEIERDDEARSRFRSDDAAVRSVTERAIEGDAESIHALAVHWMQRSEKLA